ncbi:MAG: tetratricopeptide repeat protein [Edaphocola sp.]
MNKHIFLLSTGLLLAGGALAQKDKLKDAAKELDKAILFQQTKKNADAVTSLKNAKEAIDAASENAETNTKAETWTTKAGIYMAMQQEEQLNQDKPYKTAIAALRKAFEIDKKLESDPKVVSLLANAVFYSFNDGIHVYNASQYADAFALFQQARQLAGPDKDKRFVLMPIIDTVRAQSSMFMAYTAYYDKKPDVAISELEEAKKSPYLANHTANMYLVLIQAYAQKGDKEKQLAAIKEARAKFPEDKNIEALELNYALQSGSQKEAIEKMEQAIAKNPSNPELYMNLGILYNTLAKPATGNPPANAQEYRDKAEAAYKKTVELSPENATYNFQLGTFYFNQAADLINAINQLGMSKEDEKKAAAMDKQKTQLFVRALPYLEKSRSILQPQKDSLKGEAFKTYVNTLTGLKEIYNRMDQEEKAGEVRKLLNELKK